MNDELEKMKLHSPDWANENIRKLAEIFPNCVTETQDTDGSIKRAIDYNQLRQELSDHIVDGPQERYHLNWPGKREALLAANAPIAKTLRPVRGESVNFDTTQNLFIEGDNLEALKLLQETYLGKVKMIYIDPPYNTGNDFIYEDDFAESADEFLERSNQKDEDGNRLVANPDSKGRFHSDWLSFIYPRLKRSKDLLTNDGVIIISVDDNEIQNLRSIGDEIFGSKNFVCQLIWKSRQIIDSRNKTNASSDHEYLVVYARQIENFKLLGKPVDGSKYSNPDNDPRGPWMSNSILGLADASQRPNLHYEVTDPHTNISYKCPTDSGWRYSKTTMAEKIADGRILFPKKIDGRPREKKFQSELSSEYTGLSTVLGEEVGFTLNGSRELRELFEGKYFDFPKPVRLVKFLIHQCTHDESLILDFFAGSSTTAQAVMQLNSEDSGKRKFIMVQLPEKCDPKSSAVVSGYSTIADVSKERIRRAGAKILEGKCHQDWNRDIGFRVLKVDTSNMKDVYYRPDEVDQSDLLFSVDNIKDGRTGEDLLFQVLVDWGVDLTLPIRHEKIDGKSVYFVDDDALIACFETGINVDFVKQLATHKPLRVVFRDNGFTSDDVKANVAQIFRQTSPDTDIKVI